MWKEQKNRSASLRSTSVRTRWVQSVRFLTLNRRTPIEDALRKRGAWRKCYAHPFESLNSEGKATRRRLPSDLFSPSNENQPLQWDPVTPNLSSGAIWNWRFGSRVLSLFGFSSRSETEVVAHSATRSDGPGKFSVSKPLL